jgi:Holliday junction resolvase
MPRINVVGTTAPPGSGAQRCAQAGEREHRTDSTTGSAAAKQPSSNQIAARKHQGGARHRRKGDRCEREIVALHLALGIHSERVPHSGAMRYRGHGADVDVYALGREECPLVSECKSRKAGGGFVQLERWLGENDLLFLRRDHAEPLVLLPWRVWARLLAEVRP